MNCTLGPSRVQEIIRDSLSPICRLERGHTASGQFRIAVSGGSVFRSATNNVSLIHVSGLAVLYGASGGNVGGGYAASCNSLVSRYDLIRDDVAIPSLVVTQDGRIKTVGEFVAPHLPAYEFAGEVVRRLVAPQTQGQRRRIVAVYLDPSNFKHIGDGHTVVIWRKPLAFGADAEGYKYMGWVFNGRFAISSPESCRLPSVVEKQSLGTAASYYSAQKKSCFLENSRPSSTRERPPRSASSKSR